MPSVNKAIVMGNLGRDPEVRFTPNGSAVCNLSIATSRSWKNKDTGEKVEETEWHRVVLYDRLAEIAGEFLRKGRVVYIEGRLKTRKWKDKEGVEKYTTEIVGEQMQLMNGGEQQGASGQTGNTRTAPPPATRTPTPAAAPSVQRTQRNPIPNMAFDSDDIPF